MEWDVDDVYLQQLKTLILNFVKNYPVKVYLYGSRAKDLAHETSDVDIALNPEGELPIGFVAKLRELAEESTVPYRVEIIDLSQVSEDFRRIVLEEGILWTD